MFFNDWDDLGRVVAAGVLACIGLIVLLRVSGKRTLAKINAFDLVVTVALGSILATILLTKDVALAGGFTGIHHAYRPPFRDRLALCALADSQQIRAGRAHLDPLSRAISARRHAARAGDGGGGALRGPPRRLRRSGRRGVRRARDQRNLLNSSAPRGRAVGSAFDVRGPRIRGATTARVRRAPGRRTGLTPRGRTRKR